MRLKIFVVTFWSFLILLGTLGCEQVEPQFNARKGNTLQFAGREWTIKHYFSRTQGPGNNYFSDHPNDVWIDKNGHLHLSIRFRNGRWECTEVVSKDKMGYGTYIFTVQGDLRNLDPNVVLGLFTWDTHNHEQANSEVDIEFSKWGILDETKTLQYGVQPIHFSEYFAERVHKPEGDHGIWTGVSTHGFTWTDTLITWESYVGEEYGVGELISSWSFDLNNPARVKVEGNISSEPVIIPAPGDSTEARMNFWLMKGFAEGPVRKVPHEVIIRNFQYFPL